MANLLQFKKDSTIDPKIRVFYSAQAMQQSNALRRLEVVLTEAVLQANGQGRAGSVLLSAMKLENQAQNIVDFYELLAKASEEVRNIRDEPKLGMYLQVLDELKQFFVTNHLWEAQWIKFSSFIQNKNILPVLNLLANFLYSQDSRSLLGEEFLDKLKNEFEGLLAEVTASDLDKELKSFLIKHLKKIISSIRRYHISGTEGLEDAAQSFTSELLLSEQTFSQEERQNSVYRRVRAFLLVLLVSLRPTPWDILSAVPDIPSFWVPTFEELVLSVEEAEQTIGETSNVEEALEKTLHIVGKRSQKSISGREQKALPPSKENL